MEDDGLLTLLRQYNLLCAVVVNSEGTIQDRVGSFAELKGYGLLEALIGPYGDPKVTFDSLEGRILPRMWVQGELFAFVCKPKVDIIGLSWSGKRCGQPKSINYSISENNS